jgi:hypothetical protein
MKVEVGELLRQLENSTWELIERAMSDAATVNDVAIAAASVRATGGMRRKLGASSAKHHDIEAEYLTGLSLRLMEIDTGEDLYSSRVAAKLISGGPIGADDAA